MRNYMFRKICIIILLSKIEMIDAGPPLVIPDGYGGPSRAQLFRDLSAARYEVNSLQKQIAALEKEKRSLQEKVEFSENSTQVLVEAEVFQEATATVTPEATLIKDRNVFQSWWNKIFLSEEN